MWDTSWWVWMMRERIGGGLVFVVLLSYLEGMDGGIWGIFLFMGDALV